MPVVCAVPTQLDCEGSFHMRHKRTHLPVDVRSKCASSVHLADCTRIIVEPGRKHQPKQIARASGHCSIVTVHALESSVSGCIVYSAMRPEVRSRLEPLPAARKRAFQHARVICVLSDDMGLEMSLVTKRGSAFLTHRSVVLALMYASDMCEHVKPVGI